MGVDVLGVSFDNFTLTDALERALQLLDDSGGHYVVTPNSEILVTTRHDAAAQQAFKEADLVLPDGIGVIKASKILGRPLKERVAGIDFAEALLSTTVEKRVYLLGAAPGVAQKAAEKLQESYPRLIFCGYQDGFFTDDAATAATIQKAAPDILFVCLGAPKQEKWMLTHKQDFGDCLMAGLGGCLNVWSGEVKRAPKIFISLGLEWFHRLITQPTRLGRMMKLPYFLLLVTRQRAKERKAGGKEAGI